MFTWTETVSSLSENISWSDTQLKPHSSIQIHLIAITDCPAHMPCSNLHSCRTIGKSGWKWIPLPHVQGSAPRSTQHERQLQVPTDILTSIIRHSLPSRAKAEFHHADQGETLLMVRKSWMQTKEWLDTSSNLGTASPNISKSAVPYHQRGCRHGRGNTLRWRLSGR
jgi:hypothetical protein